MSALFWADDNVRIVRLTEQDEISALIRLFEGVAAAEGWQPGGALQSWRGRSIYFGLQISGHLVGGLQLVLPDGAGALPCQNVWPEVPLIGPARRNAHIAVLAIEEASRGQGILFWRLVVEMWRYCISAGIAMLFIEVTPRVLPIYRRLGWPLVIQGQLRRHWGEDCQLCTLGIPDVAAALLLRAERSVFYREIIAQAFRMTAPIAIPVVMPKAAKRRLEPAHQVRETFAIYSTQ